MEYTEVKIEIFIPIAYVEALREALNAAGACKVGRYDNCMSVTQVSGYWRPLAGAQPFQGEVGKICHGQECKVEVRCRKECIGDAIKAIRKVHPYEEPLVNIVPLLNPLFEM